MSGQEDSPSLPPALFDLEKAIAIARADFPEETKNITFVDLSLPDAPARLAQWMNEADPVFREKHLDGGTVEDFAENGLDHGGFGVKDALSGKTLIAVRSRPRNDSFIFPDRATDLAYTFCHELGHGIVENGIPRMMLELIFQPAEDQYWEMIKQVNLAENVADTFAAVYGVSKGWLKDAGDVGRIGFATTISPWFNANLTHFTSLAIDSLVLDIDKMDIPSLSPQEIRAIAARHAKEFSPARDELMQATLAFAKGYVSASNRLDEKEMQPGKEIEIDEAAQEAQREKAFNDSLQKTFENLAGAYLTAPRNTLLYYIAQRTLAEVATTGQLKNIDHTFDVTGPFWDDVRQTLKSRESEDSRKNLLAGLAQTKNEITQEQVEAPSLRQFLIARNKP